MHIKKIISSAIISMMAISLLPAYASNDDLLILDSPVIVEQRLPTAVSYFGTVSYIITVDDKIIAITITEEGLSSERRFNISEQTVVIDNESAIADNLASIKKGDKIAVYASPISTFSIPPQSSAYVVLTNIKEKSPAKLVKVQDVIQTEDGSIKISDTDNQYIVSVTQDTSLLPYRTRQFVTMDSIQKEDYILFWSEIMTLSLPAQTTANCVVLLKGFDFGKPIATEEEAITETAAVEENTVITAVEENTKVTALNKIIVSTQAGVISAKGVEICLEPNETFYKNEKGVYMLPIRAISEAFGYTVEWTGEGKRVDIFKGAQTYNLSIGKKECGKQRMLLTLENEPELINGITYVPVEFLTDVMGLETVISDAHV